MTDAILGQRRMWLGTSDRSFALTAAAGTTTFSPSHTAEAFVPGDKSTRRAVVQRTCDAAFETLYWRPGDHDILTWLDNQEEIACLCELGNGAAFYVKGPRPSFNINAPTDNLIQVTGAIENGSDFLGLVGNKLAIFGEDQLPAQPSFHPRAAVPGYANWEFERGTPTYLVTAVDEFTRDGANKQAQMQWKISNMLDQDGNAVAASTKFLWSISGGNDEDVVKGAGLQHVEAYTNSVRLQQRGLIGELQLMQTPGIATGTLHAGVYLMQQVGAADL